MLPGDETDAAMVEFRNADAIPAALDKNQKKMDGGSAIHVAMLWRATLYVTNFPKAMDDASLRKLFEQVSCTIPCRLQLTHQYGKILQTRWPSRKYADSRRFCYITMESPAAAQNALILHNFKVDGSAFPMQVLVSDPSAKKKRSDASNSTLFVGGLNAKTTEADVKRLFSEYGSIANIKLGWDNAKRICKGFAFVDMATLDEAKAALAANGKPYHGKGLKVELSDPNYANKKHEGGAQGKGTAAARAAMERRARQVCLFDLPTGTQEGLLQQALEKLVPVKRLEIFEHKKEAVVELESQNDAGLLLMRTEPFIFNGATIRIVDQNAAVEHKSKEQHKRPAGAASGSGTAVAAEGSSRHGPPLIPQSSLAFAPRARKAAKPLGKAYVTPKAAKASAAAAPAPAAGSGQDAFRAFMTATNEQRKDKLEAKVAGVAGVAGTKHALEPEEDGSGAPGEGGEEREGSEPKRAKKD